MATTLLSIGESGRAQTPLPIELVLSAPVIASFSQPSFSSDGRLLAYTVVDNNRRPGAYGMDRFYRTGVPSSALGADIWLSDLVTGEHRNLTGGKGNNWAASWSPDGRRIAFLSDRGSRAPAGGARLWVWERSSDVLHQVGQLSLTGLRHRLDWAGDGRSVLVETFPAGMSPDAYAASMDGNPSKHMSDSTGVTAAVFSFDPSSPDSVPRTDQVNLDILRVALVLIDVESGVARSVVQDARILDYVVSPDRRRVAYAAIRAYERPGSGQLVADLAIHELGTGKTRVAVTGARLGFPDPRGLFSWSPTGQALAYRTGGPLAKDALYVVSAGGGPPRRIAEGPPIDLQERIDLPLWDGAGRYVFFTRSGALWRAAADGSGAARFAAAPERRLGMIGTWSGQIWSEDSGASAVVATQSPSTKMVGLARVSLASGAVTQIAEEARRYGGYGNDPVVSPDGHALAYVAEDAEHPPEFWLREGDLRKARQASRIAPKLAGYTLGAAKVIEWRGLDGDTLHGALIYPAGYQTGKRYPLIVVVYGGSEISNNLNRFGFHIAPVENLQLFATRGYAVLLADSKVNVGTPTLDLLKTVMPGIDRAIELGVADPGRIGITGQSYGGYSTLALLTQSPRFKAAVMRGGMGDLIGGYGQLAPDGTNYGLSWAEAGQGRMGGSPWEFRERYLENSPFLYLDRVRTPLLIIHGADDDAVPSFLADQVFTGIRRLGKRVTYARYAGEGHWEGEWSHANQVDYLTRVLAWFDRYLSLTRSR